MQTYRFAKWKKKKLKNPFLLENIDKTKILLYV